MGDSPRSSTRTSRKRAAILEAATTAFCNEGYDTTSMDRIAEVASVSKRTVYNHFGSKEALLNAVIEQLFAQIAALQHIPWDPKRAIEDQLMAFAATKTSVASDPTWAGIIRVVLGVFITNPDFAREAFQRSEEGSHALEEWLQAAHDAGRLHVPDPERAAFQFWSMISGGLFWPRIIGFDAPMDADKEAEMTRDLIKTFLARYQA